MKNLLIIAALALTVFIWPAAALAAPEIGGGGSVAVSAGKQDACLALKEIDKSKACGTGDAKVSSIIKSVIRILSIIVGFVSVIMIIIAGFKYVTSGGDSNSVAGAKTTLIYAIVGLIVVAIAQVIVATVLSGTIESTKTSGLVDSISLI